uniref:Uncharacterized protein n=1 Tax=Cacopsylla melanoneura TaxID=428564 RepID=A0A8D9BGB9_9HEMI
MYFHHILQRFQQGLIVLAILSRYHHYVIVHEIFYQFWKTPHSIVMVIDSSSPVSSIGSKYKLIMVSPVLIGSCFKLMVTVICSHWLFMFSIINNSTTWLHQCCIHITVYNK